MKKLMQMVRFLSQKAYNKYVIMAFIGTMFIMENNFFGKMYIQKNIPDFEMIDMNFYNSINGIVQYLIELGTFGRNSYLTLLWIDLLLAVTFFLLQATLLTRLLHAIGKRDFQWIIVLPLLRSIADLFENISLMIAIINFTAPVTWVLHIARIATPIKWIFMYITIPILLLLIVLNIMKICRKKLIKGIIECK